jgi:DNA-binding phage protein
LTARLAVYWWFCDNVGFTAASQYVLWMAVRESGKTMDDIAKRLAVRAHQIWAAFDAEKDPMLSTLILIGRAVNHRLDFGLVT